MAGTNPGFSAEAFRNGIRVAMNMGLAEPPDAPVFHFPSVRSNSLGAPADQAGLPFDPDIDVDTTPTQAPVSVPCALEFFDSNGQPARGFGTIHPTRVEVTLLDEDHAQVEGCSHVVISGETYHYRQTIPQVGLFDVEVFQMMFTVDSEG